MKKIKNLLLIFSIFFIFPFSFSKVNAEPYKCYYDFCDGLTIIYDNKTGKLEEIEAKETYKCTINTEKIRNLTYVPELVCPTLNYITTSEKIGYESYTVSNGHDLGSHPIPKSKSHDPKKSGLIEKTTGSAKELSMLCEYNISDKNAGLSFCLYSKDSNNNDVKVKNPWAMKKGTLFPAVGNVNVTRFWKSDKNEDGEKVRGYSDGNSDYYWGDFNTRKYCNKYAIYEESGNHYILFDDESKDRALKLAKSKNPKIYTVKQTNNYNCDGDSPLKQEFVGQLTCGNSNNDKEVIRFHKSLPVFTSRLYDFLKIATPVVIIITGMLDIVKAVTAQKEDDMKKAQKKLISRLIAGSIVFLVFVIVELVINFVAVDEVDNAMDCVNCFLNGESNCSTAP